MAWNKLLEHETWKFSELLKGLNYEQCKSDKCLFKKHKNTNYSYIIEYVDNIWVAKNAAGTLELHKEVSHQFEIKNERKSLPVSICEYNLLRGRKHPDT